MTLRSALKTFIRSLETRRSWIFLLGLLTASVFFGLSALEPGIATHINNRIYDSFLSSARHPDLSKVPAIVAIDEKSLSAYGQWPWPRYRTAMLLDRIRESSPAAVLTDFFYPEPDRTSPMSIRHDLKRDLGINIGLGNLTEKDMDNDRVFAKALSQGPFIIGYKFLFDDKTEKGAGCEPPPLKAAVINKPASDAAVFMNLHEASGVICNLQELSAAAAGSGFINVRPDKDGIFRRAPLVIRYKNRYYPSLGLATVMKAGNIDSVALRASSQGLEEIVLEETAIPVDHLGNLLIKFPPADFPENISAADIIGGNFDPAQFRGRIVIVGASAGGLGDLHTVPGGRLTPGIDAHAAIIWNIMGKDYLARPSWAGGLEAVLAMIFGAAAALIVACSGAWRSLILVSALSIGALAGAQWIFTDFSVFISPFMPAGSAVSVLLALTLFKYWIKEREIREKTRQTLLTQDFTILSLSSMIEARDRETGNHTIRCRNYIAALCRKLKSNPKYSSWLDDTKIDELSKSAPLHDIGKIAVSDVILRKSSRLTPPEYEEIKKHAIEGYNAIDHAEKMSGGGLDTSFLNTAKEMVLSHHERWDGTGYPQGLYGEAIPFAGRVMAVADVYDAVTSKRVYKPACPHEEAVKIIAENRGKRFDPDIVDAFLQVHEEFRAISGRLPDE
jgi:adenylate cyclase